MLGGLVLWLIICWRCLCSVLLSGVIVGGNWVGVVIEKLCCVCGMCCVLEKLEWEMLLLCRLCG